MDKPNYWVKF